MLGLKLTPAPRAALLARDRARSDDLETDDGPDPVRPPAEPPIHPFTGNFADSEHTVAYRSRVFRMMMPLHIVAMAIMIGIALFVLASAVSTGNAASEVASEVAVTVCFVLGLSARIAVHRWEDQANAQRVGAIAWTLTAVLCIAFDCTARPACSNIRAGTWIYGCPLFALVNATHGMAFWHTTLLVGLMLCDLARDRFFCGNLLAINLAIIFVLVVHAFCHFQALLNRHAFLETDDLHASRERLEYDFKRLEASLHRLASRLPAVACEQAGGSVPSESSDSTSTATGQGARSAPGAMVGRERRPVPEDGHRGERTSAMRCAGAAQSNARSSADGHASKPTRRCSWSAETLAAGTSSAPSAYSSTGRSARRKTRRIRREWLADERASLEFAIRRSPYINI
jgi:hypothetical protein